MVDYNRRKFVKSAIASIASAAAFGLLDPLTGCVGRPCRLNLERRPSHRVLADLHVHTLINEWNKRTPQGVAAPGLATISSRLLNKTRSDFKSCYQAGVDLMCVAHFNAFDEWLSMPTDPSTDALAHTMQMIEMLEEELAGKSSAYASLASTAEELVRMTGVDKNSSEYRVAVVHTLEGGHTLGGRLESVEEFARRGVAMIGITHFFNKGIASAANAYPFFPDTDSRHPHQGVSEFGCEVIAEMERLGIIVDVTHCTSTALHEVLEQVDKPLVSTHASSRTLGDHPYSHHDEHIQEIARNGGLIGVIIYPFALSNYGRISQAEKYGSLIDVVDTIKHICKICGDHKALAVGSDFGGFITGPNDLHDLACIHKLRTLLLKEFDATIVDDIMANNTIEFLRTNWTFGV